MLAFIIISFVLSSQKEKKGKRPSDVNYALGTDLVKEEVGYRDAPLF